MPNELQSVFKNVGNCGSYRRIIGDEVIFCFRSLNSVVKSDVHDDGGIGFRRNFRSKVLRGLMMISKYGIYR